jgi:tetratricopeptide (TPR) repeat protein
MVSSGTLPEAMTPELWQRLKPLFHAAMDREAEARAGFVAEVCGADAELKQHLLLLIQANEEPTGSLDRPLADVKSLLDSSASRFQPGEVLLGRFRIIRPLGRGGMGQVFEAEDLQLGRIALKTIRPDISGSNEVFSRFVREVQLARKVSGPQICRIHELFVLPAYGRSPATAFLTMEYLEGVTLASRLEQSGPLPPREALRISLDICEGLRLIHQQGIVHRDLKCANIMLCGRDDKARAALMDFGLASDTARDLRVSQDTTVSRIPFTSAGAIAGTPAYMAPEQFEGKPVSPATDVYALGVVLYELTTGRQPYAADTPVGAAIRRARRPEPVSSIQRRIPHHWDRVIHRCLEYEPEKRFQSAQQVAEALRAGPLNIHNLAVDRPWLVRFATALLLILVAWGVFAWWRSRQYYRPGAEAEHWYREGLASLREASYLKATREMGKATVLDDRFAMAHARLAEAWSNLDFDGTAEREMLIASSGESRVPPLDRMYLDAIRGTLTGGSKDVLDLYRKILDRLPESEKASGYVDLGMAYERASDPQNALASYQKSSALNSDNPASYLRAAILETRLNKVQEANRDFARAESLYKAEVNPEGEAELDYQRGYLANEREANDEATADLDRALSEAEHLPNVQLEIRALNQLSSVAYHSTHDDEALALAQRAIRLARDNQLDSWAAEGFVRLASVALYHDYSKADEPLQEAFQILRQSPQSRVEAMANLTLASLRNQQNRPNDVLGPATAALAYYQTNGHFLEAAQSSLLIARAQRGLGHSDQALQAGFQLVDLSKHAGKRELQIQAEELLGTIYIAREDYPRASDHFQTAFSLAGDGNYKPYEALHEAEIFVPVGRFADAERMLALALPSNPSVPELRVKMLLEQRKFAKAEILAADVAKEPGLPSDVRYDLAVDRAVAEALGGHAKSGVTILRGIAEARATPDDPVSAATQNLNTGTVCLAAGDAECAFDAASKAESYFSSVGLKDSDLRSALIAARAARLRHDAVNERLFTQKSIDILTDLRHTWSPPIFHSYISRPDFQSLGGDILPPSN